MVLLAGCRGCCWPSVLAAKQSLQFPAQFNQQQTNQRINNMNINNAFPSDYLKASDLGDASPTVTIESVELVDVGQGRDKEQKILIRFAGKKKGLICNKTNANTIAKLYGPETDGWVGQKIILQAREVEFAGEMVWAIRVSLQKPAAAAPVPAPTHGMMGKPKGKQPLPEPEPEPELPAEGEPEVPF